MQTVKKGEVLLSAKGLQKRFGTLDVLRGGIGYVPQDNFLFSATIAENIRFYAPEATMEDIEQAAKLADI